MTPPVETNFASARERYRPALIRYLIVAEAPPRRDSGRFFYFEHVTDGDSLFLEMMKALYPGDCVSADDIRPRKRQLLERFRADGFYLIDSVDEPFAERKRSFKVARIRESLPVLKDRIRGLCRPETKIILVAEPVYSVCAHALRADGFNIINHEMIDFPGSGRQAQFRSKFTALLAAHDQARPEAR